MRWRKGREISRSDSMATTTVPAPPVAASSTDALPPPALPADAAGAAGDPAAAEDQSADEASEAEPPPPQVETPLSDQEILNNLLKECELLTNENALLSDYILVNVILTSSPIGFCTMVLFS